MRLVALLGLAAACAGANGNEGQDASRPLDARGSADARPGYDARPGPDADASGPDGSGSPDGGSPTYGHTIAIDGVNDFSAADERFATSTTGFFAYVSWDSTYLYVGVEGADVAANDSQRWVLIYIGGSGGSTIGVQYNTQQPELPFGARYHLRWRTDNAFTEAQQHGAGWSALAWDFTGDVYQSGTFVELRIPRADIGSPATVPLHVSMINEAGGGEWTFSGAPASSFADGYDPPYGAYYEFDLGAATVPSAYAAITP